MIEHQSISVAVKQLVLSAQNVRQSPRLDILKLAESIHQQGLLQSLVVTKREVKGKDCFEVVDGGRRYEAIKELLRRGKIKSDHKVACVLVQESQAISASLTSNIERQIMHSADEFQAFRALVDAGKSVEDVAAEFGVTPLVVSRRLKLANVAPSLLELYRRDAIDLESLMCFASTDDHVRQEKVWAQLPKHDRGARAIRAALTAKEVPSTDRLVRFVGLKAYRKAGGAVRVDLFSDKGLSYVEDVSLLQQLAQGKLDKKAEQLQHEEGSAWAEGRITLDYSERSGFGSVGTIRKEPTAKQAAQLKKLNEELKALEAAAACAEEWGAEDEQIDALNEQIDEIEQALVRPDPRAAKLAGLIVTVDPNGRSEVIRGLVRAADKKALKNLPKSGTGEGVHADEKREAESELSAALTLNLAAHFTAGLRCRVELSPSVALRALVASLVTKVFDPSAGWDDNPVTVEIRQPNLESNAPELKLQEGAISFQLRHAEWHKELAAADEGVFGWLMGQTDEHVMNLLAHCTACSLDAMRNSGPQELAVQIAAATGLDMRDYWQATTEGFLKRVPKAVIVAALRDVNPQGDFTAVEKAKKPEAMTLAEPLLLAARWLPHVLRQGVAPTQA